MPPPRLIGLRVLVAGPTLDTCVAWASALERAGMIVEHVVGASRVLDALARKRDVDVIVCGLGLEERASCPEPRLARTSS